MLAAQGMVQGALSSVKALAQGVGPLIYSGLFSLFSHKDSKLPYFPGGCLSWLTVKCLKAGILSGRSCAATVDASGALPHPNKSSRPVTCMVWHHSAAHRSRQWLTLWPRHEHPCSCPTCFGP